ncbi:hypothetical protein WJX73_006288 [Symbiochloris irregularis]|uniref:Alpha-glucosidase n=1 Tax=Symbiochloris irregularis TaxID=706552 RepID=A0AAW1PE75_9CHLO
MCVSSKVNVGNLYQKFCEKAAKDLLILPATRLQDFVSGLHKDGQRWVPILDPPIHIQPGYTPYDTGLAQDVFIKDITGQPYVGELWPGAVHFPDFMNPAAVSWWQSQIQGLYSQAPLDGIWLDMNEASNFCGGDVCEAAGYVPPANDYICRLTCQWGPMTNSSMNNGGTAQVPPGIFDPPYRINNGNSQANLSDKAIAVTAQHYDGTLEYNAHNLYGTYQAKATAEALQAIRNKRPFVLSRSSFVGSGAYTAHWTGDSASTWQDLRWQINAVLQPGLVGISFAGADICGFQNIATAELCARWIAMAAWQPYARDHHAQSFQELYRWPKVAEVSRKVLEWRMRALPYLYTAAYDSYMRGCPIARPVWFSFPSDASTLDLKEQWIVGDALLIAPIVHKGMTSKEVYFPAGVWYSLYDYSSIDATNGSRNATVRANVTDNTPVYIMGGSILPFGQGGMTTTAAEKSNLTLIVALADAASTAAVERCNGACPVHEGAVLSACGHMYLDQGEELGTGTGADNFVFFSALTTADTGNASSGKLLIQVGGNSSQAVPASSVIVNPEPSSVTIHWLNEPLICGQNITVLWSS